MYAPCPFSHKPMRHAEWVSFRFRSVSFHHFLSFATFWRSVVPTSPRALHATPHSPAPTSPAPPTQPQSLSATYPTLHLQPSTPCGPMSSAVLTNGQPFAQRVGRAFGVVVGAAHGMGGAQAGCKVHDAWHWVHGGCGAWLGRVCLAARTADPQSLPREVKVGTRHNVVHLARVLSTCDIGTQHAGLPLSHCRR